MKYSSSKANQARAWISTHGLSEYGGATLPQYCTYMGISDQTHYRWMESHVEYVEAVIKGREVYKAALKEEAVTGLRELISGYTTEEKTTKYISDPDGNPLLSEQVIKERHVPRNTAAIIFALTNLDPDHWKNRQQNETKLDAEGISVVIGAGGGVPARTTEEAD